MVMLFLGSDGGVVSLSHKVCCLVPVGICFSDGPKGCVVFICPSHCLFLSMVEVVVAGLYAGALSCLPGCG